MVLNIMNVINSIEMRYATIDDYVSIAKLHHDSWHSTFDTMLPKVYTLEQTQEFLNSYWKKFFEKKDKEKMVLVALHENTIVGFIAAGPIDNPSKSMAGYTREIHKLYVSVNSTSRGIGTILLRHCLKELSGLGHDRVMVRVFHKNSKACKFYEKNSAIFLSEEDFADYHGTLKAHVYGFIEKR